MLRKRTTFAAALAATTLVSFVGAQMSDARAQDGESAQTLSIDPAAQSASTEADALAETMPVFVTNEVVQELPEEPEPAAAQAAPAGDYASLDQLVAATPTDGALSDELQCLAGAIYFEARGEPISGQLAVAQVVINRAESRTFPSSYCGVVYQRAQFSFVRGGSMPRIKTGSAAWKRAKAIARIAHQGLWDSEAGDALYFHAHYVKPSWSRRKTALAQIDTHVFYR